MPDQPETSNAARILVVADTIMLAEDLTLSLMNLGYELTGRLSSADEAVRSVEESKPDLILMDFKLERESNGIEVAEQIRSRFDIPVVYLTDFDDSEFLERAKQTRPYGYLRKAANPLEMRYTIEMALCRHEADKRLRESEERVQLALKGANLGLWDWDLVTGDVFFDERSAEILGYSHDDIKTVTREWAEFIHPEDRTWVMEKVKAHLEGRTPFYESEYRRRHKSGKWIRVKSRGQVVARDTEGKPLRVTGTHLDVTELKESEKARAGNEARAGMKLDPIVSRESDIGNLELADVIDAGEIQMLMDDFYGLTNIGVGIIDLKGKVLVATGWQEICTKFHRVHPETCQNCIASDTELSSGVEEGTFKLYRCLNNMWDIATPIVVGGNHLGNLFLGQFLFDDDTPDYEIFRSQVRKYGFDEEQYISALDRVPRWSRETVERVMRFYAKMTHIFSTLSYTNIELVRSLTERERLVDSLQESEERYRAVVDSIEIGISLLSPAMEIVEVNKAVKKYFPQLRPGCGQICYERYNDPPRSEPCSYCPCILTLQDGKVHEATTETLAGSETRHYHLISSPIKDVRGRVQYVIGLTQDITDPKKAEEALRESEQRYRTLFERSTDGIMIIDLEGDRAGQIVQANPVAAKMHGYEVDELLSLRISDLDTPESAERVPRRIERILAGEWLREETCHRRKDGSVFPIEISASLVKILDHKYALATDRDITERKEAEEQLKLNEARLQSLYKISRHKSKTIQDLLDFALDEAIRLTGSKVGYIYSYDEKRRVFELNTWSRDVMKECEMAEPPALYELDNSGLWGEAVRQRRAIVVNDFREPTSLKKANPQGHVEMRNFITVPAFVAEKIVAVVGVANDDTHYDESDMRQLALLIDSVWKIAEAKHSELEQRLLATALENAAEGIVITDIDGTIQYVNPSLEMMTGYSREELLGKNAKVLKSGKQTSEFYHQLWRTIKGGDIWAGRLVNKRKDGTLYTEDATISPVRDSSGTITHFVGTKRDITEHLALSKQLAHAQKMEAIGTLAGGIAHDFNNLLQIILGYSDLLGVKTAPEDPDRKKLEVIQQAARDGADLVGRILTFSRKAESKTRPIDLNEEIRKAQRLLRRTIPRMIEIRLVLADDLRIIDADPGQVEQILLNLAVNAHHAMPDGGELLIETRNVSLGNEYFRTHLEAKPGHYALLTVSDTGIGMPPEMLDRVFEPFFTTKTNEEGTGLGLSMVHGIVSQHGGHIRCYSELGVGTTFKIYFPVSASELITRPISTREIPALGTGTVLLVDDDDRVREMAVQIMEMGGYKVLAARSGEEALEIYAARSSEIPLVILDLIMPGMGGRKCLEGLLDLDPSVKVVIASGYSAEGYRLDAMSAGATRFIAKPYDFSELLEVIRDVLDAE